MPHYLSVAPWGMLYQLSHGDIDLSASTTTRFMPQSAQQPLWKKKYKIICSLFYADNSTMTQHESLSDSVVPDHLKGK